MKILYIDHGGVVSDSHMYQYYGDLYRELKSLAQVILYEGPVDDINRILRFYPPVDCVVFGLGYFAQSNPQVYRKIPGLSELSIPVVAMLHKPQNLLAEKLEFCKINNMDLLLDSQSTYKKHGEIAGIKATRSWFTATPNVYHPRDVKKSYDLGFCGALHGNGKIQGKTKDLRVKIHNLLDSNHINTYWNASNTLDYRINSTEEYATKINECKLWLATTGPTEDVSPRFFEVMLSKTLLFCNEMPEQYGDVFEDGFNCVTFKNDLSDFMEKLVYYLEDEAARALIIERAYKFCLGDYTWKHMALNLLEEIKGIKNDRV